MTLPVRSHDKQVDESYLASDVPTICYGILVISDGASPIRVDLWDSDDELSVGDVWLGAVDIGAVPGDGGLTQGLFFGPNGVHCSKGLWAELTGGGEFTVYTQ